ncbi:MAG: PQQ-binding-like beta-propeller repeat protein [Acidobacteria bacterium]|nr:PQQ-binding-like beta-propeller repeat protein [Acidobacteriota bacterium]
MSASRILRSLDFGAMSRVARPLNRQERIAVSSFLGRNTPDPPPPPAAFCQDAAPSLDLTASASWNGWSPGTANARYQDRTLRASDLPRLRLKWAFAFEGDATSFAPPSVLGNWLFTGSASGMVYALNVDTGCIRWTYQASGPVRTALLISSSPARVLFGDQTGWFYALDARSGKELWKRKVEDHDSARITASPVANNGAVYVAVASWEETRATNPGYVCCTFRGSVSALRIADGSTIWKTYTITETPVQRGVNSANQPRFGPSGAGVWGTPTVDRKRNLLYIATGDNFSAPATDTSDAVMALRLDTGKLVWHQQFTKNDIFTSGCLGANRNPNCPEGQVGPDFDFGSSAILVPVRPGRELLLAGQKSGMVHAMDPDARGAVVWQSRAGKGGVLGGIQWGMAVDASHVYAAVSDVAFTPPKPSPTAISADLVNNQGGGLTAFRISDGAKVWFAPPQACPPDASRCSPAQSAALTAIPGAVLSGSLDGHLRAYSTADGSVLWDLNTVREYDAVNGSKGRGGSLDGPGAVIANGMLFVNSGYSRFGGMPGNVLLAFFPDNSR